MKGLTGTQQSFIALMKTSDELAMRGFQLLLKRDDFPAFFTPLKDAGFFAPEENPAPTPTSKNTVHIPFWAPLNYLKAVAEYAHKTQDEALAMQVLSVVRTVTTWRDENNQPRRNYHTSHTFAQILAFIPTKIISMSDIDLIREWIDDSYERMLVTDAIDQGLVARLLESVTPDDHEKAARVLEHMTAITRHKGENGDAEPFLIVDDYWLQRFIDHHATGIGEKAGKAPTDIMLQRTREVFGTGLRKDHSTIFRPAIEGHTQNHHFRSAENRIVDALRDVLLGWAASAPEETKQVVKQMLGDNLEIIRRVGIYVLARHWSNMKELYNGIARPGFFNSGHNHELYHLLQDCFAQMPVEQQNATLDAINNLPTPKYGDEPEVIRKHQQLRWLSAISGLGNPAADSRFTELKEELGVDAVSEHPDFNSYMTTRNGPGGSPYSSEELTKLAAARVVVENLNTFKAEFALRGPTVDGLKSALASAARGSPQVFLNVLSDFHTARLEYQHEVINGLKQAWEAKDASADWNRGWQQLLTYFEETIHDDNFWQEAEDDHQHWFVSMIADTLHVGTQNDEHAYEPMLLERAQAIIDQLLQREPPAPETNVDAMLQALNTPKGRIVEALFSHALRAARVSDKTSGSHEKVWATLQPIFERELVLCKNANFEFSTLCGAYLPQLQYLDDAWTDQHVNLIFPAEYEVNMVCALDGLAYASFTRPLYEVLTKYRVVDRALSLALKGRDTREKVLGRIAGGYLWGIETLDGPRFEHIFKHATPKDIETLTWVFWTVRDEELKPEQREGIIAFWERAIEWSNRQSQRPEQTLSQLSLLAAHVSSVGERELALLEAVAPYVSEGYNHYEFVDELLRLPPDNHEGILAVTSKMLQSHVPDYDYEDRLRQLLALLASKGHREAVLLEAERVRHLPGIQELYKDLTK